MKRKTIFQHNKKQLLIGISIGLLTLASGLTAYALTTKHTPQVQGPDASGRNTQQDDTKFVMTTTFGLSYRATEITTYNGEQPERTQIMDRDAANGASRLTSLTNGELTAKVFSGEVTYSCDRTSCVKMPWRDDAPYADNTIQNLYDFSPNAIKDLASHVSYQGETSCAVGMCVRWDATLTDPYTSSTYIQTLYIDKRTKSLVKIVRGTPQNGSTVTYNYTPRTITMPPIPQELPEL